MSTGTQTPSREHPSARYLRPVRFDAFTVFVQALAWGAALSQAVLIIYLLAV